MRSSIAGGAGIAWGPGDRRSARRTFSIKSVPCDIVGLSIFPKLMECALGRRGHVADLGPAAGDLGHLRNPAGFARSAAKIPFLHRADESIEQLGPKAPCPGAIDEAL